MHNAALTRDVTGWRPRYVYMRALSRCKQITKSSTLISSSICMATTTDEQVLRSTILNRAEFATGPSYPVADWMPARRHLTNHKTVRKLRRISPSASVLAVLTRSPHYRSDWQALPLAEWRGHPRRPHAPLMILTFPVHRGLVKREPYVGRKAAWKPR
jgi:hypothetical protein